MIELTANFELIHRLPPWLEMWLLVAMVFFTGKIAAAWPLRRELGAAGGMAFGFFWVGMDAAPFVAAFRQQTGRGAPLFHGLLRMALGAVLLWGLTRHLTTPLLQGWCGMVGLVCLLHFGAFEVLAAFWRALGVQVVPIMNQPSRAVSLSDFWGRRWNKAFRDLAHPFIFAPVARHWGLTAALWVSFAGSGLVHELVISIPAGAGYGRPTLYFLLQAAGMTWERRLFKGSHPTGRRDHLQRWLFTHAFTVLPLPLLFHPPFVERVVAPFLHELGALP